MAQDYTPKKIGRREFLRNAALTTGGIMLVACGSPAATTTNTPAATRHLRPTSLRQPRPSQSTEIIELTTMSPDRELGRKVDKIAIDTFNKKMEAEGKPYRMKENVGPATDNDFLTKITVDASAGTLADVVSLGTSWVADLAASDALLDLTDKRQGMARLPADLSGHSRIRARSTISIGRLPGGASTFTFFYRKDVLDKAGICHRTAENLG